MTVRVGFLGTGLIAAYHLISMQSSGADAACTAVYDPDRQRAESFVLGNGAAVCDSEHEVLDRCDAVYVCTWTSEHQRLVSAAAERGVAVFCEKPLAFNHQAATAMARTVERAGVVNQVGLVLRHSPVFNLLRDLIADPASGRLMNVVFRDDQYIPVQGMYASTWRGDRAKAGSGTLLEHSIHDFDVVEYIAGPVSSVSARTANFHGLEGIEDSVVTSLGFASGGLGVMASVWHDVLERPSLRRVEVFGERLYATLDDDWFGPLTWTVTGQPERTLGGEDLVAEVERRGLPSGNADGAFIQAVADGGQAWPSFADAVRAHELVDAVYQSARTGTTVAVSVQVEGAAGAP